MGHGDGSGQGQGQGQGQGHGEGKGKGEKGVFAGACCKFLIRFLSFGKIEYRTDRKKQVMI